MNSAIATCQAMYRFAARPPETAFYHKWCGKNHLPFFPPVTHLSYRMTSFIKNNKISPAFDFANKTKHSCLFHHFVRQRKNTPSAQKNSNFEFVKFANLILSKNIADTPLRRLSAITSTC